ncbi:MAG: hypothetical protein ACI9SP_002426 [Arenicella sp.]|jgi:hypothetical protein
MTKPEAPFCGDEGVINYPAFRLDFVVALLLFFSNWASTDDFVDNAIFKTLHTRLDSIRFTGITLVGQ